MGSGSSKDAAAAASSSVKVRKPKPRRIRVFDSSCFGLSSILSDGHQVGYLFFSSVSLDVVLVLIQIMTVDLSCETLDLFLVGGEPIG